MVLENQESMKTETNRQLISSLAPSQNQQNHPVEIQMLRSYNELAVSETGG